LAIIRHIGVELEECFDKASTNQTRSRRRIVPKGELADLIRQDPTGMLDLSGLFSAQGKPPASDKDEVEVLPLPDDEQRQRMFDEAMTELNALIGLDAIKRDIKELIAFIQVQGFREEQNLTSVQTSLHTVFSGNPGTGKTTVARILGRLLCGLEILERGHTVETDRSGLVAGYVGQTGPKTQAKIDEAIDGVLFVDEAYSLTPEGTEENFGAEAIQAILKRMEDDRDKLVVVLAGYPEPMQRLIESNPGLESRFQRTFIFDDFTAEQLFQIFHAICKKNHYRLLGETKQTLLDHFNSMIATKDRNFGNGRLARNLFEKAIRKHAARIAEVTPLTVELLTTLLPEDVPSPSSMHS